MNKEQKLGSETAKKGFKNEKDIVFKFNNWENDGEAQTWLNIMGYKLSEIEFCEAIVLSGYKTDVQVQVTIKLKKAIDVENLQVKLVSNLKGFNQIDKRWVDKYVEMWSIPENVSKLLKEYTGELEPTIKNPKDSRRTFINEFSKSKQRLLLNWIENNKTLIVNDIIKGRGKFSAEWMLVAQNIDTNARWILKPINIVINHFGNGEVIITKQGNIKVGRITMQRKGGDGGRETAKMLQFKINPAELFEIINT
ncbi:MAG: hypothetical protein K9J13_06505 [Saprospiraceae bacterium]|nr:hypothetical protein [Saprospiraceae bacterium]